MSILKGSNENDTIQSNGYNDYLYGYAGNDKYVFDIGDGQDIIYETSGDDTIEFGPGITSESLLFRRSGNNLIISVGEGTDRITVSNWFYKSSYQIENITFSTEGITPLTKEDILDRVTVSGTDRSETIKGTNERDNLQGKKGNDLIYGYAGNDTYIYNAGDGADKIIESSGNDTIKFIDISRDQITFNKSGNNLVIRRTGSTDSLTLYNFYAATGYQIENIDFFSSDDLIGKQAILNEVTISGKSELPSVTETIYASKENDIIDAGAGKDYIYDYGGDDNYYYSSGDGTDIIYESSGNDTINFTDLNADQVTFSKSGNHLILKAPNDTDKIVLYNFYSGSKYQIENINFANGDPLIGKQAILDQVTITGKTSSTETIYGSRENDIIDAGAGKDYIYDYGGDDNYYYSSGDGTDIIYESSGNDTINFTDLNADQVTFSKSGNHLILKTPNDTDKIVLYNFYSGSKYQIENINFANGDPLIGKQAILDQVTITGKLESPSVTETIYASKENDIIDAGAGKDYIYDYGGDDTYKYSSGDGTDIIYESSGTDTINFTDLIKSDLKFEKSGNSLVLTHIDNPTDKIIISNFYLGSKYQIENIFFDIDIDNNLTGKADILNEVTISGKSELPSVTEKIYASKENDIIDAGAGKDYIYDYGGDDTYKYSSGDGTDIIYESSGTDTINFTDLIKSDLKFEKSGNSLVLTHIDNPTDKIIISNFYLGSKYQIENIDFFSSADLIGKQAILDQVTITGVSNTLTETVYGSRENDIIDAGLGNDVIYGYSGNDTYYFSIGDKKDTIIDSAGTDKIVFTGSISRNDLDFIRSGYDLIIKYSSTDQITIKNWSTTGNRIETIEFLSGDTLDNVQSFIIGTTGNDNKTGTSNNDVIYTSQGNDTINGSSGADTMTGRAGNDVYYIDNPDDTIVELENQGVDIAFSNITYTLSNNIENLTLSGSGNINGIGNSLNNSITGNSGNNILDGGTGADTLIGGDGDDTYYVDNIDDIVQESGTDIDTVISTISYTLGNNLENLTLNGSENINGTGNTLNNSIEGNAGNNTLDGGMGADTLIGGDGDDTYYVDNIDDIVQESGTGIDTVISNISYTLGANLENLDLIGNDSVTGTGNELNNTITGNNSNNTLDGGTGADTLIGGDGDDTYYVDNIGDIVDENTSTGIDCVISSISYSLTTNVENLTLQSGTNAINGYGNTLNNTMTGNAGNNILDGGLGADTLIGGDGHDTYYIDNTDDVIQELGIGTDTVISSISYSLGNNLENLVLSGTENINGTGNALNNSIQGNSGNNTLDGGLGADTLIGGDGYDTYYVDDSGDTITEELNQGTDIVISTISHTLGNNIENLTLTGVSAINGTGNTLNNTITGNNSNNNLDGGLGADTLIGGDGYDTYYVDDSGDIITEELNQGTDIVISTISHTLGNNLENLILDGSENINGTGNTLNNSIEGNSGNNTLDGGMGADTLIGGDGDDTYYIDNIGDIVQESGTGIDTVISTISYTLGNNVENITLSGSENINATGNDLNNTIIGNSGDNILSDASGNDTLYGGYGNDIYTCGTGDDRFNDVDGDDTYIFSNGWGTDRIVDTGGNDTLDFSSVTNNLNIQLNSAVSDLIDANNTINIAGIIVESVISGSGNDNLIGGSSNESMSGMAGNDTLDGGTGADTLIGGDGNDTYYVDDSGDIITEELNQGTDIVISTISHTLGNNLENLTLTGAGAINGTGNTLNNTITGNNSNNSLYGLAGDDYLYGGLGTDSIYGEAGNDTYIFNSGDGQDIIMDEYKVAYYDWGIHYNYYDAGVDTLSFGEGITSDNIKFRGYNSDLIITFTDSSDSVNITNYFADYYKIESITFSDGTSLNYSDVVSRLVTYGNDSNETISGSVEKETIYGMAGDDSISASSGNDTAFGGLGNDTINGNYGNDYLYGNEGDDYLYGNEDNDYLYGNEGNDTLAGGAGNDVYHFNQGDGQDLFKDEYIISTGWRSSAVTDGGVDSLSFGEGLDTSNMTFQQVDNNLEISVNNSTDKITIFNHYDSNYRIENFLFADGTNMTYQQIYDISHKKIYGDSLDNVLTSYDTNDTIYGYAGNDSLIGGGGDDTYIFTDGFGHDTISDTSGHNTIDLTQISNSHPIWAYLPNEKIIVDSDGISGWGFNDNTGDDYIKIPASTFDTLKLNNAYGNTVSFVTNNFTFDTIIGGSGRDLLAIQSFSNAIEANLSTGNVVSNADTLTALYFEDINTGSGNDTIIGNSSANQLNGGSGDDTYIFSDGFNSDYILGSSMGVDTLDFSAVTNNLTINLETKLVSAGGFDTVNFSTVTLERFIGGSGSDTLTGSSIADNLDGSAGNDILSGLAGNDTLTGGAGNDNLSGGLGDDTYIFDDGFGTDAISDEFGINILDFSGVTNSLTIDPMYTKIASNALGNSVDLSALSINNAAKIIGGTGNDVIYDTLGDDTLIGGLGNDTLFGMQGNDTYVFTDNWGKDSIYPGYWDSEGINTFDFSGVAVGHNLTVNLLTETVNYDVNNSVIYDNSVIANVIGGAGNDTITGGNYFNTETSITNTLTGGAGNDSLIGGIGNDTYKFALGDGVDTINDSEGTDKVFFDATVGKSQIALFLDGSNDLIIDYGTVSGNDKITVQSQNINTMERLEYSDGTFLTNADIASIVGYISSYDAAHEELTITSINDVKVNTDLMTYITAQWHN